MSFIRKELSWFKSLTKHLIHLPSPHQVTMSEWIRPFNALCVEWKALAAILVLNEIMYAPRVCSYFPHFSFCEFFFLVG